MTMYKIRQTSPTYWFLTLFLTIFLGFVIIIVIATKIGILNFGVYALLMTPIIFIAFILPRYSATVDIEIIMDEIGIKKKWIRQFIFQHRSDIEVNWLEISEYIFEPRRQFSKLKISLKDGSKISFYHNNDHEGKDEFLKFLNDLKIRINQINISGENNIKKGATIYETGWGLLLAAILILCMIGIPIFILINRANRINYAGIAGFYIGALYFLIQVIIHRTKNKNEN